MARVGKSAWLDGALALLKEEGAAALTIAHLCQRMGKTKGSFYHHFGDVQGLRDALLDRWELEHTEAFIEASDEASPGERMKVLDRLAAQADWERERIFRAWAWKDESVAGRVAAVDRRRIQYLASLYPKPANASMLATLEYCALLGAQQLLLGSVPGADGAGDRALSEAEGLEAAATLRRALMALVKASG